MPVNSAANAGYALNLGAVSVVGTFLGMPIEAMLLGGIAGAIAHGRQPVQSRVRGISTILTSIVLAGALSPVVSSYLVFAIDFADASTEAEAWRPVVPVVIGAAWPWALPHLATAAKRLLDAWVLRAEQLMGAIGNLFKGGKS